MRNQIANNVPVSVAPDKAIHVPVAATDLPGPAGLRSSRDVSAVAVATHRLPPDPAAGAGGRRLRGRFTASGQSGQNKKSRSWAAIGPTRKDNTIPISSARR